MQWAIFQQATNTQHPTQATRVLPGHGTGLQNQAANDEASQDEYSWPQLLLSVLANVIGGSILLSAMLVLPHVIARALG